VGDHSSTDVLTASSERGSHDQPDPSSSPPLRRSAPRAPPA
jgi:hypothetical protein